MSTSSTVVPNSSRGEGNTKPPPAPSKQISPAKHWCWTLNNPSHPTTQITLVPLFQEQCVLWQFQYEKGESGTPHYQGFASFKTKVRPMSVIKVPGIHWEKTRGSLEDNTKYTSKTEGRLAGPWNNLPRPVVDPMQGLTPRPWQAEILELIKPIPDRRTIHWYFDTLGEQGKTSLAIHICLNRKAMYVSGKATDIKCGLSLFLDKCHEVEVVFFDFVRSSEQYVSYEAIEAIKNGIFFSGKYEGGMRIFNPPHVICFANYPPDETKLSQDRWHIVNISPVTFNQ